MTVPYYIVKDKSDMRGIKHGWYAIEDDGNLSSRRTTFLAASGVEAAKYRTHNEQLSKQWSAYQIRQTF